MPRNQRLSRQERSPVSRNNSNSASVNSFKKERGAHGGHSKMRKNIKRTLANSIRAYQDSIISINSNNPIHTALPLTAKQKQQEEQECSQLKTLEQPRHSVQDLKSFNLKQTTTKTMANRQAANSALKQHQQLAGVLGANSYNPHQYKTVNQQQIAGGSTSSGTHAAKSTGKLANNQNKRMFNNFLESMDGGQNLNVQNVSSAQNAYHQQQQASRGRGSSNSATNSKMSNSTHAMRLMHNNTVQGSGNGRSSLQGGKRNKNLVSTSVHIGSQQNSSSLGVSNNQFAISAHIPSNPSSSHQQPVGTYHQNSQSNSASYQAMRTSHAGNFLIGAATKAVGKSGSSQQKVMEGGVANFSSQSAVKATFDSNSKNGANLNDPKNSSMEIPRGGGVAAISNSIGSAAMGGGVIGMVQNTTSSANNTTNLTNTNQLLSNTIGSPALNQSAAMQAQAKALAAKNAKQWLNASFNDVSKSTNNIINQMSTSAYASNQSATLNNTQTHTHTHTHTSSNHLQQHQNSKQTPNSSTTNATKISKVGLKSHHGLAKVTTQTQQQTSAGVFPLGTSHDTSNSRQPSLQDSNPNYHNPGAAAHLNYSDIQRANTSLGGNSNHQQQNRSQEGASHGGEFVGVRSHSSHAGHLPSHKTLQMNQKERLSEIGKVYNYTGEIPHFNVTANSNKHGSGGLESNGNMLQHPAHSSSIQPNNNSKSHLSSTNNIKIQSGKKISQQQQMILGQQQQNSNQKASAPFVKDSTKRSATGGTGSNVNNIPMAHHAHQNQHTKQVIANSLVNQIENGLGYGATVMQSQTIAQHAFNGRHSLESSGLLMGGANNRASSIPQGNKQLRTLQNPLLLDAHSSKNGMILQGSQKGTSNNKGGSKSKQSRASAHSNYNSNLQTQSQHAGLVSTTQSSQSNYKQLLNNSSQQTKQMQVPLRSSIESGQRGGNGQRKATLPPSHYSNGRAGMNIIGGARAASSSLEKHIGGNISIDIDQISLTNANSHGQNTKVPGSKKRKGNNNQSGNSHLHNSLKHTTMNGQQANLLGMSQAAAIKKAHVAALQKKHGVNVRYGGRAENGSSQASYQTTVPANQRSSTIVHGGSSSSQMRGALSSGGKHHHNGGMLSTAAADPILQNSSVGLSGEFNQSAMSGGNESDNKTMQKRLSQNEKIVSASVDKKGHQNLDQSFQFGAGAQMQQQSSLTKQQTNAQNNSSSFGQHQMSLGSNALEANGAASGMNTLQDSDARYEQQQLNAKIRIKQNNQNSGGVPPVGGPQIRSSYEGPIDMEDDDDVQIGGVQTSADRQQQNLIKVQQAKIVESKLVQALRSSSINLSTSTALKNNKDNLKASIEHNINTQDVSPNLTAFSACLQALEELGSLDQTYAPILFQVRNSLALQQEQVELSQRARQKIKQNDAEELAKQKLSMKEVSSKENKDKEEKEQIQKEKKKNEEVNQEDLKKASEADKLKIKNLERVVKEIKKQLACYKTEIASIKKTESYITMENYQKLVNDFNSLYDHYKAAKGLNKKLKAELQQSNQRERTFLKLLKKTKEYGEQASKLEKEYDRLFTEDGLSKDPAIGGPGAVIQKGGVTIPKLDFSVIYLQREQQSSDNQEDEGGSQDQQQQDPNQQQQKGGGAYYQKQNNSA